MALCYAENMNQFVDMCWWLQILLSVLDAWIQPDPIKIFLKCEDEEEAQFANI